jgi:hypothetical protein
MGTPVVPFQNVNLFRGSLDLTPFRPEIFFAKGKRA